uniref:Lyase n=1 Tax=Mimiviridae sp. ChoanoV1 TaxID=2596887 RepID=A0A5B8IIH1_9VIRU|nr:lyase [Mimiviridae sp. ChoanoV1]
MENRLLSISPIDGRYNKETEDLKSYHNEYSFIRYRIIVEIEYLLALNELDIFDKIDKDEIEFLQNIYKNFSIDDAKRVLEIESKTKHDVKAIEYFIVEKIKQNKSLVDKGIEIFVHFCLTSQDVNSTANILIMKSTINKIILPKLNSILKIVKKYILEWSKTVMLSRTHGQPASPTFLGKEFLVFYERLVIQARKLTNIKYTTKFGGAVGNFNAHIMALPNIDWVEFADKFIGKFGIERNQYTTQIDHYDNYSEIFDILRRINIILIDMSRDMWSYISRDYFKLRMTEDQVGSSAMPHKNNPIYFEKAEANLLLSNAIWNLFSNTLPISRMQRDLRDSSLLRNLGTGFSYMLISLNSIETGLDKLDINKKILEKDLEKNHLVILEGIVGRLKLVDNLNTYDLFKNVSRIDDSKNEIEKIISNLDIDDDEKKYIKTCKPNTYTGLYKL